MSPYCDWSQTPSELLLYSSMEVTWAIKKESQQSVFLFSPDPLKGNHCEFICNAVHLYVLHISSSIGQSYCVVCLLCCFLHLCLMFICITVPATGRD